MLTYFFHSGCTIDLSISDQDTLIQSYGAQNFFSETAPVVFALMCVPVCQDILVPCVRQVGFRQADTHKCRKQSSL